MAEPFLSEIRMYGFGWAPRGWATCDGQLLPISQNQALFSLLGVQFGGNGQTDFGLPDMRGRVPQHAIGSQKIQMGTKAGLETVTITEAELPEHTHAVQGTTSNGDTKVFSSSIFAAGYDRQHSQNTNVYAPATNLSSLNPGSVSSNGSPGSHNNMQPSSVVNFCISITGTYPTRSD